MRKFNIKIEFDEKNNEGQILARFSNAEIVTILSKKMELYCEDWTNDPIEQAMKNAIYRPEIEEILERKKIFVSRHKGAYGWFNKHHPKLAENCEYKNHIITEEIAGNIIIGTLPINLSVNAEEYWHLTMNIPAEMRGKELTIEDMEALDCKIERYEIKKIEEN